MQDISSNSGIKQRFVHMLYGTYFNKITVYCTLLFTCRIPFTLTKQAVIP